MSADDAQSVINEVNLLFSVDERRRLEQLDQSQLLLLQEFMEDRGALSDEDSQRQDRSWTSWADGRRRSKAPAGRTSETESNGGQRGRDVFLLGVAGEELKQSRGLIDKMRSLLTLQQKELTKLSIENKRLESLVLERDDRIAELEGQLRQNQKLAESMETIALQVNSCLDEARRSQVREQQIESQQQEIARLESIVQHCNRLLEQQLPD